MLRRNFALLCALRLLPEAGSVNAVEHVELAQKDGN